MSEELHHVALPQLRGQPAYARPPRPVEVLARPFDPDELPLQVFMTDDEREMAEMLAARPYRPADSNGHGPALGPSDGSGLRPRAFRLRSIAGRLIGGRD